MIFESLQWVQLWWIDTLTTGMQLEVAPLCLIALAFLSILCPPQPLNKTCASSGHSERIFAIESTRVTLRTLNIKDCVDRQKKERESQHIAHTQEAQQGWLPANPIAESWSPLAQELRHHKLQWRRNKRQEEDGCLWIRTERLVEPTHASVLIKSRRVLTRRVTSADDPKQSASLHTKQQERKTTSAVSSFIQRRLHSRAQSTPKQGDGPQTRERRTLGRHSRWRASGEIKFPRRWEKTTQSHLCATVWQRAARLLFRWCRQTANERKQRASVFVFFVHDIITRGVGNSSQHCQLEYVTHPPEDMVPH